MDSYLWRPEENLNVLVVIKRGFHALGCMAGRIILYKDLGASLLLTRPEMLLKDVSVGVLVATLLASFVAILLLFVRNNDKVAKLAITEAPPHQ